MFTTRATDAIVARLRAVLHALASNKALGLRRETSGLLNEAPRFSHRMFPVLLSVSVLALAWSLTAAPVAHAAAGSSKPNSGGGHAVTAPTLHHGGNSAIYDASGHHSRNTNTASSHPDAGFLGGVNL